ncbi:hypothetical protein AMTR_s00054p00020020 [Amborella trichopoda]|uniref:Uncharacterized protein n=1 Tax=Amborella trichopoda TaxID=13333 RepID=U5CXR7_AMBTC|nr:hypothetical protein AMTR_s00054p00020020 [Amborella trichopoda]
MHCALSLLQSVMPTRRCPSFSSRTHLALPPLSMHAFSPSRLSPCIFTVPTAVRLPALPRARITMRLPSRASPVPTCREHHRCATYHRMTHTAS